jgi:large subunit ribosomal protein L24
MQITKPRTQRRKLFQAPAHRRQKQFSALLADNLKKKHGTNAAPVKTGDTVRLMRGDRKGFEGKVIRVDRQKYKIFVEGVTREKVDGTAVPIPIHPSKVMIINLNLDDKWRRETLKRKGIAEAEPQPSKPAEKEQETKIVQKPEKRQAKKKPRRKKGKTREKPAPKKEKKTEKVRKPRRKKTKKAETGKGAD